MAERARPTLRCLREDLGFPSRVPMHRWMRSSTRPPGRARVRPGHDPSYLAVALTYSTVSTRPRPADVREYHRVGNLR